MACRSAARHDTGTLWREHRRKAAGWFLGDNDIGEAMIDPVSGGGYDGLTSDGANLNQGAESTMAMLTALTAGLDGTVRLLGRTGPVGGGG
jgi:hypothetical protein